MKLLKSRMSKYLRNNYVFLKKIEYIELREIHIFQYYVNTMKKMNDSQLNEFIEYTRDEMKKINLR